MGYLAIRKLEYSGDKYVFESPTFEDGLSIIEGPNGGGKSTFFNLIYYGLGGRVLEFEPTSNEIHEEIVGDANNLVRLVVEIDGEVYILNRKFGDSTITVIKSEPEADGVRSPAEAETLPIFRREDAKTFSDWLLDKLQIPVVDIFQGGKQFKLNFVDLARLIYHNQTDASVILKPADYHNYVSDSLEIRRAIFQILVGKTLLELYRAIGQQKLAERDALAARAVYSEYQDIVSVLLKAGGATETKNAKALREQIDTLDNEIAVLLKIRRAYSSGQIGVVAANRAVETDAEQLREMEAHRRELDEQRDRLVKEASRLRDVERALEADIQRINKVIYTHGQLNLFSRDTCPYCLNDVARVPGHCVCGHGVDEQEYQRFFYSPAEYLDILKSKTKSLETLRFAIKDIHDDSKRWNLERNDIAKKLAERRERFEAAVSEPDRVDQAMEELDMNLLNARERLAKLEEAYRLESKLQELLKRADNKKAILERVRGEVKRLDLDSQEELLAQISAFCAIYNEFMTNVVVDCRSAEIDTQTYMPVIDGGKYKEHSATVPRRFLYFLTLLQLSLLSDIPFPRLLLVDTPENAGIDLEPYLKMLLQIDTLKNPHLRKFQILFSTGENKYPAEFEEKVVLRLSKKDRLLKVRPQREC